MKGKYIIFTLISVLFLIHTSNATHFRYGNIVWNLPDPDNFPTLVEFKITLSYELNLLTLLPTVGSILSPGFIDYGDGTREPISLIVSLLDNLVDLLQGTYTTRHYFQIGTSPRNFTVAHYTGGRYAFLKNNAFDFYNISTVVTLNQYVTGRKGRRVLNQSPVASMYPIVTVYSGAITNFIIPAYDRESSNLMFSLSTATDMGDATSTQPPQLSINSTSGVMTFNTNGVASGYWNTQIKVSDGLSYTVVDFIIYVTRTPSTVPCLVASLPVQGLSLDLHVGLDLDLQISSFLLSSTILSTILPPTLNVNLDIDANLRLSWRPTLKDKGSYPMTFGCRSTFGIFCPASCQISFVVNVVDPYCGYGTIIPADCNVNSGNCSCQCPTGYDVGTNCTTCLDGFYGTNCTQCQCGPHGTCASGMAGSGACTCESGWRGSKCDIPSKPCSFSLPGYIRQVTNTTTSLITPTLTNVVVSGVNTVVNLTAAIPLPPPKIDILLLVDTSITVSLSSLANLQGALAANFITGITGLSPSVYIGLSTFTNPTSCLLSLDVNLKLSLTASIGDFNAALGAYLRPSLNLLCFSRPQGSQLGAIINAAGTAAGWRSDAYKIIVVVTESVFGEGGTLYAVRSDVRRALLAVNAVPIFIVPSTVQSVYGALVNDLGFGSVGTMLTSWSNAYSVSLSFIRASLNTIWTVIQDSQSLAQVLNATYQITPPALAPISVAVKNVNQLPSLSDITVNVVGWGVAVITPQVNQAPQASVVSVTTREDIGTTVPLNGTDPDGDSLTVVLDSLPSKGLFYTNSSASDLVKINTPYALPDGTNIPLFYYVPNLHYFGTDSFRFYLNDGCTRSASASANLTITFYNYPPTAADASTFTNENENATIQLTVSDVEDATSALVSFIRSLPEASLATLYHINNGSAVKVNDQIATSAMHSVKYVPKLYACCETTQFTFQVRDTAGQTSSLATVSTFIVHVNQGPTAYATSPVIVERGVTTPITISVSDPDVADTETFTITAIGSGSYIDVQNRSYITAVPYNFAPVSVAEINTASLIINYTSPLFSMASSVISYFVTDAGGLASAPLSVTVNIKANTNPVATAVGTVSTPFYSTSSVFYLYGTDSDAADTPSTLSITIFSLPVRGTLRVNDQNISSVPTTFSNNASFYIFGNGVFTGNDQFTFRVVDSVGGRSSLQTVLLRFIAVNRPPTGSIGTIVTRKDVEVVGRINANDPDRDTLTVRILSLPANGTLKQFDGTSITTPTSLTDTSFQFRFLPGPHEFGSPYTTFTFLVDDGTSSANSQSAIITATVNVTYFDYPPSAVSTNVSIPQDSGANNITISTTDIETPATTVAIILSLPLAAAGVLTDINGHPLAVGSTIAAPWLLQFIPAPRYVGTTSFQFKANDGTQDSNQIGTLTITVARRNLPPTSRVYLGTAVRQVSFPINLVVGDPNIGDALTITVLSFGGLGTFSYPDARSRAVFPGSAPFNLPYTITIPQSGSSSLVLNYLAPSEASGNNYANFSFYVTDQTNLSSPVTNVTINIATNNTPPGANATSINATQDQTSAPVILSGYDEDVADQGTLRIYITILPSKGTLAQGSTNITEAPTLVTGPITYTTYERGVDSFFFIVMDNLDTSSNAMEVPIYITPVNHAPTLSFFGLPLIVQEDARTTISQIFTFDQDGDNVTVYVLDVPTLGSMTQFDGTPITSPNTAITDAQNRIIYIPAGAEQFDQSTTFSVYGSDNTGTPNSNTSSVVASINIIHRPRPPVVYDSSVSLDPTVTSVDVTPNVTDVDTSLENVTITIQFLPDPELAELEHNSVPLEVGAVIPYNFTITLILKGKPGYTTFSFSASDGVVQSTTFGVFGIGIRNPINSPPIAIVASDSLAAQRGIPLSIVIGAHDEDALEVFTFDVQVQATGGSLALGNGTTIAPPSFSIVVNQDVNAYVTNTNFYFTAPANAIGDGYLIVNFTVYDSARNSSETVGIIIDIAPNNPPVATPPPTISFDEETNSTAFNLTGYDSDTADANSLQVTITSLPSKGTLYVVGGEPVVIGQLYPQTTQFFIIGGPLQFGDDSLTYQLVDNVGGTSAVQQVSISITHVNHPPTGSIHLPEGIMNQPLSMQIYGQDVDPDSFITAYITELPTQGYLTQTDGTVITGASPSNPVVVTNGAGRLIYIPPTYVFGINISTISFFVADNSGAPNNRSITYTVPINIAKGDLPPVAYDSNANANDGGSVTIPLNVSDPQGYPLVATITQFPSSGALYRSDGSLITPDSPTVGSDNVVIFVPTNGTFGQAFTFSYQVSSPQSGLSSNQATVSLNVLRVYKAPTYSGLTFISIPENTEANILFSATSEADFYSIQILSTPSNGTLAFVTSNGSLVEITGLAPYLLNDSNSENRVKYLPPIDTYGDDLVFITIQVVDIHGVSTPVNITISVYHINIAPKVVPTTYESVGLTRNWTNIVTINENQCASIAWDLYDPDSHRSNLSSLIASLPFRGNLYEYLVDGSQGNLITAQSTIYASSDGFFRVVYCPDLGKSGNNFASFSVMGSDNIAMSSRQYVNMRVVHINVPPTVNITQPYWNTSINQQTLITGVSVADEDARVFKIKFVLTLDFVSDSGEVMQTDANHIGLYEYDEVLCNTTTESVTCVATVDKLNTFLNQITLAGQTTAGVATITVFVDDMGDGTNEDPRNATGTVNVTVIPSDVARSAGNNNVLTATVASAAVAGAAVAAGVYAYLRKRSPPTSTFFGLEQGMTSGALNENPLYEGGITMENTLYRAPTFGMQKI